MFEHMMYPSTYTYKTVKGVPLQLDIFIPEAIDTKKGAPAVLIFNHGGFLYEGSKNLWVPKWVKEEAARRDWIMISPNYRLMPESTCLDIIEDYEDVFKWIKDELPKVLSFPVNNDNILVTGPSAGGFLTILLCSLFPVKAGLAMFPMADASGPPYTKGKVELYDLTDEEVARTITNMKARKGIVVTGYHPEKHTNGEYDKSGVRAMFCASSLKADLFPDHMSGIDGLRDQILEKGEESIPEDVKKCFPLCRPFVKAKNFPPIAFVHGKDDDRTPIEESYRLEERVKEAGTPYKFIEFDSAAHGFDKDLSESEIDAHPHFKRLREIFPWLDQFA